MQKRNPANFFERILLAQKSEDFGQVNGEARMPELWKGSPPPLRSRA